MAQVLAVPGDVRHGFAYKATFDHEFGRITGIAVTTMGNSLLCDYDNKCLILIDPLGKYVKKISVESAPFDVAITSQNIGYVTLPNMSSLIQIDPDRLVVLHKVTINENFATISCVSAVPNSGREKGLFYLGVKTCDVLYTYPIEKNNLWLPIKNITGHGYPICHSVVKFHAFDNNTFISCIGGQNYINISKCTTPGLLCTEQIVDIETMVLPTDICSDDYGHVYVSGQGSNNIHRLTKDGKVIDIPLDSRHGITQPVALCFNKNHDKFYIVNQWGKSVLVFDVI
ncbi:uncharacterized protein LOC134691683 [Mytilus trossulus]|uniref:uncharacterized protein LOC134691683 n=1 Tax=Mytilus trossulus TaxID=6551 RepID=UPI0030057469